MPKHPHTKEEYARRRQLGLCSRCGQRPRVRTSSWCNRCIGQHSDIKMLHGITRKQYEEMFLAQGGKCAICKLPETRTQKGELTNLAVDHCHATGRIRKLLCNNCNNGLGRFKDNPYLLRQAAKYLLNHKEKEF